ARPESGNISSIPKNALEPLLTPEQVSERYRISVPTLANWRAQRQGPDFLRAGREIFYKLTYLLRWESTRTVICNPDGPDLRDDEGLYPPQSTNLSRKG